MSQGSEIERRRSAVKWGQRALGKAAGVSRETVLKIEADNKTVKPKTIQKVLTALERRERDLARQTKGEPSLLTKVGPHADTPALTAAQIIASELQEIARHLFRVIAKLETLGLIDPPPPHPPADGKLDRRRGR